MKKAKLETVTLNDGKHLTGYKDELVFQSWQRGVYHEQVMLEQFFLSRSDKIHCVYDIGANLGNHSIYFASHSNAKVFSFEPVPMTFDLLKTNVEQNGLSEKVKLFSFALGSEESVSKIQVGGAGKLAYSSITGTNLTTGYETQQVPVKRLDDLNLPLPDFVKIDVEDYEFQVLKGAERTLREASSAVLWIEIRDDNKDMPEIYQFLSSLGYIPADCQPSRPVDILFIKQDVSAEEKVRQVCEFIPKIKLASIQHERALIESFKSSHSWKITAPLRALRGIFRRK